VITSVESLLGPFDTDPTVFRQRLDENERQRIPREGYGIAKFINSLVDTVQSFLHPRADGILAARVRELATVALNRQPEILEGIPETLEYLHRRYPLFLVTKGDREEQLRKFEGSNLGKYFKGAEVLKEKHEEAYRRLLRKYGWNPGRTWMIGNSPRFDTNPAIRAGMNAVYVPNPLTWKLERGDPLQHPRLIELEKFSDLRAHF